MGQPKSYVSDLKAWSLENVTGLNKIYSQLVVFMDAKTESVT